MDLPLTAGLRDLFRLAILTPLLTNPLAGWDGRIGASDLFRLLTYFLLL